MTARIGIVTCERFPDLIDDEHLTFEPMRALGMEPEPVRWDAAGDWDRYDALVIRSPWDYFERPSEFAAWIDTRDGQSPPTFNPPSVLRWNMNKHYLREMESAGIPVVETEWLARGTASIEDAMARRGWDRAVVKPTVSGGAFRTYRLSRDESVPAEAEALTETHDVMVQPFLDQIVDEGEWTFVFLGGAFVGALIKRAAPGDYRVQMQYGGTSTFVPDPPSGLVEQAAKTLAFPPGDLLYARVDGIRDGDRLVLIELEVLEPLLFFGTIPGSAQRYAAALASRLSGRASGV